MSPYQGLSRDMAAYMLNLNIEIGMNERVMGMLLWWGKGWEGIGDMG